MLTGKRSNWGRKLIAVAGLATGMVTSCAIPMAPPDDSPPPDMTDVSFENQIQPILSAECEVCHISGGIADLRGIALQLTEGVSFDLMVNQQSVQNPNLTLVIPGDASHSLLFQKISSTSSPVGVRMPWFLPPLDQGEIDLIEAWINQGALNN